MDEDRKESGFKDRTRVDDARELLAERVTQLDRTETVTVAEADGRVLAEPVESDRNVPDYPKAAMDGFAVRASDTFGASDRSPEILRVVDEDPMPGEAVRVHTGSALPGGADAVVMIEHTDTFGDEVEVFDALAEGENVAPVGEDVREGQHLYDPGHRLRPSDLGLLRSVGIESVSVFEPPSVGVIPTGEELVDSDPGPGEVIETNSLTVSRLADRWGAEATRYDVVTDDYEQLKTAIADACKEHDVVATTGGSSVGERDLVPEVVDELGEVFVHGVALKPGHPVALGLVEDTPVVMLPGYPVACIVNAVQFLRYAVKWTGSLPIEEPPTNPAMLDRKIPSEPGVRTYARVRFDSKDGQRVAVPVRAGGSGVLSSVALSDGWVEIREGIEGLPEGDLIAVQNWEWSA
ncbi:gephyrin-like molybdotransferase Glp [Haloarchaeobius sp. HME9146]|uniref:molybdopterin molybdotransferase MoeA n=1 Tax=Haloarchaeobius sp. HME9146 TaxID=2978732 RepID=UPI0021BEFCC0|nr:gephyrin-like molybdotransferase Glp [Haloarchaeobius sp. HME9146]MCT9097650.1 molybdopterin molybdotransferase MoeA [Haloarchaeobius sp. HME9146]